MRELHHRQLARNHRQRDLALQAIVAEFSVLLVDGLVVENLLVGGPVDHFLDVCVGIQAEDFV